MPTEELLLHRLTTELTWEDLVLPPKTLDEIHEIEKWINYSESLLQNSGMRQKLKPSYLAMFYGPPGTGKTFTASLLGKKTGKEVYKIDLSMVVSKYIGETEKNLSNLFDRAENKDWILFFDEADALFGKRTNIRDSHDRYANQEVSYLLQRVETFDGLVLLASNFKENIDEAFTRRFHSIIYFPIPGTKERSILWQRAFPKNVKIDQKIDLEQIAKNKKLTGANIQNISRRAILSSLERKKNLIDEKLLNQCIDQELINEEKRD